MIRYIPVDLWQKELRTLPVIDVRSPAEFSRGHIPGAINIPLFTDDERTAVSITYNQGAKQKAIELGYQIAQPKLQWFIAHSSETAPDGEAVVHCWRGGMRSNAFATVLDNNGFRKVWVIENGYKAYRNHVLASFENPFMLRVLGGYSGSGKTEILHCLAKKGQQIIDLEGLANHRGSAFGGIDMPPQPTTEQFENDLLCVLQTLDPNKPVWIEDESNAIGRVNLPGSWFAQMSRSPLIFLNIPVHQRVKHLVDTYARMKQEHLAESIRKLTKRLGYDQTRIALEALDKDDFQRVAEIMLYFYDKYYLKGSQKRDPSKVVEVVLNSVNHEENAARLLQLSF
ncbi:MAG TPA: tRNA 2-selenouridine(34) synthase MnmH [Bacteroidales bacterium]|nr:tRNA 2-selenouridine(34) synthase MnmH [Bacteroidales bacterium]HRZ49260.1 tRNA 2-selenouridine(34) synthase MnmH [Bacteroidales bacterium]